MTLSFKNAQGIEFEKNKKNVERVGIKKNIKENDVNLKNNLILNLREMKKAGIKSTK